LCAISVALSALPTYNAALNRPAYQSSEYSDDRGSYGANLANDGNRETSAVKNDTPTCVISGTDTNPWWAVDLGRPTTIYRVDFTTRGDSVLERCSYVVWSFARFSYCVVLFILYIVEVCDIILSRFCVCHSCADESYAGVSGNVKRAGWRHEVSVGRYRVRW